MKQQLEEIAFTTFRNRRDFFLDKLGVDTAAESVEACREYEISLRKALSLFEFGGGSRDKEEYVLSLFLMIRNIEECFFVRKAFTGDWRRA